MLTIFHKLIIIEFQPAGAAFGEPNQFVTNFLTSALLKFNLVIVYHPIALDNFLDEVMNRELPKICENILGYIDLLLYHVQGSAVGSRLGSAGPRM
jgi:hypothetical protein